MEIVEFNFKGKTIHLPQHKEKILELTCGEKWKILIKVIFGKMKQKTCMFKLQINHLS